MVKEVLTTVLEILIVSIVVSLLPQFGILLKKIGCFLIKLRIQVCVKRADKKFKGRKLGAKKKAYVLAKTERYNKTLEKMNTSVDSVIESTVAMLNTKSVALKTDLQTNVPLALDETANSIVKGKSTNSTDNSQG